MKPIGVSILLLVLCSPPAVSQEQRLQGEIHSSSPVDLSWLTVRFESLLTTQPAETAQVRPDGTFELRRLSQGPYTLRVLNRAGDEIASQQITVGPVNGVISVRLPDLSESRPPAEATSVQRLMHKPSRQALNTARAAQKFADSGDSGRAVAEYQKVLAIDPDFSEVRGNLGAQYLRMGRPAEAVPQLQRAIELDPHTAIHQSNLAVAFFELGRFDEAEAWARGAVRLDGANPIPHYVLGSLLARTPRGRVEAVGELKLAAESMPAAQRTLAELRKVMGTEP